MREDIEPIFSKDFVSVGINTDPDIMKSGVEVMSTYNGGYRGTPWLAVLDPDGKVIATSDDPEKGNIGFPQADWEIAYWKTMIRTAARRITEEEIEFLGTTFTQDSTLP